MGRKMNLMSEEMTYAFNNNQKKKIVEMLENGESLDVYHKDLAAPLLVIALEKEWNDLAYYLIQHGANVNIASINSRCTPLMVAAHNADLEMVKNLITKGADKLKLSEAGFNARAYYAATYGEDNSELINLLTPNT
jgi:ankyrin repeat protein